MALHSGQVLDVNNTSTSEEQQLYNGYTPEIATNAGYLEVPELPA